MRIRLDRYILSEIIGPLGLGFLVYTFILLLRFLFQSAEMIIRRGLPIAMVGKLLLVSLPNIVVLTLPMSLLFGVLIAVGRLSSDSELIAMRSSGVSLLTLFRPILVLSAFFTCMNVLLMLYVLPWGNHSLQQLRLDIMTQTMSQQVEPRVFYEEWVGKTIYVFEQPRPGNRWHGVFLAESPQGNQVNTQITTADWGDIIVDESGERVVLRLTNAFRHTVDLNDPVKYEISKYLTLDVVLEDSFTSDQKAKISAAKGIRELTLTELRRVNRDSKASIEQHRLAQVEINKKFSIPVACIVFGLFGLPLGITNRRGGKASGFAVSIAVIIVYYILLNNGEEAARAGQLPPWLAMWLPNMILSAIGFWVLVRRNRDRGLLVSGLDRMVRITLWGKLRKIARPVRKGQGRGTASEPEAVAVPMGKRLVLKVQRPRISFPSLIDRYIAGLFARVFLLALTCGVVLFVIFDLNEIIDDILKHHISAVYILNYYKYMSLQIFYEISPIVVLVTTLITFILLTRTNEITACKALGMSLYRLALPALVAALSITAIGGYLESGALPAANERVAQARDKIHGREAAHTYRRADRQWLFGQGRYIYNYIHYDRASRTLQRLQVFDFDANRRLTRRLFSESATYVGDAWVFSKGWARQFDGNIITHFDSFEEPRIVRYPETPSYFEAEIKPPDQMAYHELKSYIKEMEASGQSSPDLRVQLYNKISYPMICFVMALVALPFAFRIGRQGTLYGIGVSLILGIVFMSVYAVFTKLGETGTLPALVSVWSPGALFALLSGYLLLGVRS
jgi:LPS export ABC transporter permease LptG/LPS export ABC transporter permease LptF